MSHLRSLFSALSTLEQTVAMFRDAWAVQIAMSEPSQVVQSHPLGRVQSSRVRCISRCLEHDGHLNSENFKNTRLVKGKGTYGLNGAHQPPTCEPQSCQKPF